MRYIDPSQPGSQQADVAETAEERLRKENQDLKRQLQEMKGLAQGGSHDAPAKLWRPSSITIWSLFLGVAVLISVAFFAGYIPLQRRRELIIGEAHQQEQSLPRVEVIQVGRG